MSVRESNYITKQDVELFTGFEMIDAPVLEKPRSEPLPPHDQCGYQPACWFKAFFRMLWKLVPISFAGGHKCEKKEPALVPELVPLAGEKAVKEETSTAVHIFLHSPEILTPTPVPPKEEYFDCPEEQDEYFDCPEPTEKQWAHFKELERLAKEHEAQSLNKSHETGRLNAQAMVPVENLNQKVWDGLCRMMRPLKPSGERVKHTASKVASEERVDKLASMVQEAVKGQVDYEVNENLGRRLIQIMLAVGVKSPLLPAINLLGFAVPGVSTLSLILMAWRLKDFRDEFNALYYEKNAMPAVSDAALTFAPQSISLLV